MGEKTKHTNNLPQGQLMSRALERNDKNCFPFVNMKSIQAVDVIVCTRLHLRSSLNPIVYNSNLISYNHRRGQHFYN